MHGHKWDEVTGDWRGLHSGYHHDLYFSHNITRLIKLRRTMWAGHVACMGKMKDAYRVLVGKT